MGILLIRYQVCWLLVSGDGEEGGYVAGSWGGQMLWGVELFGGLYGAKVEFDVTLVSWVNNRQTNL